MTSPLLERDIERAFELVVADWQIERLDTKLGTEDCARYLKSMNQVVGCSTVLHDDEGNELPYGGHQESWCFKLDARSKGIEVQIIHSAEYHGPEWSIEGLSEWVEAIKAGETILREGRISWNRFANMATVAACELRGAREPEVGEQLALV